MGGLPRTPGPGEQTPGRRKVPECNSSQGRAHQLVALPGTSPARLTNIRERRIATAKTPWTPTPSASKPTIQESSHNSNFHTHGSGGAAGGNPPVPASPTPCPPEHIVTTTSYTMDRKKLVKQLQARADNNQPLISSASKDSGACVVLTCMASVFASTVRPAFSCFSVGFTRTLDTITVCLPAPPVHTQDKAGLVKDVKLAFSVLTSTGTHPATVHLYSTTCKLQVQGGAMMSTEPNASTVAEWFTDTFVIPRIQNHIDSSKINTEKLEAINAAIRDLPSQPNSTPTAGTTLPSHSASTSTGINRPTFKALCAACGKANWRTLTPSTCLRLFRFQILGNIIHCSIRGLPLDLP